MIETRRARVTDAAAIVELGRVVDPNQLSTPETVRTLLERETPPATERLVVERGGEVVCWAPSGMYESGVGWFWIGVLPEHRRRGIGGSMYARIEERLTAERADRIETTPNDEEGRVFLRNRSFEVATTVRVSRLDPRAVSADARRPEGCVVVALRDAVRDADALFGLYSEGRGDVPSRSERAKWTFAEWRAETVDNPLLDLDASVVVLENGVPVSLAWIYSDRDGHRGETLMAATRRDRRGLGLATLAKIESTRRAAELGITSLLTANDLDNVAMLAINRRLGFEPTVVVESFAKPLHAT
jgi:GNAT superfamily N-acetyltransferase